MDTGISSVISMLSNLWDELGLDPGVGPSPSAYRTPLLSKGGVSIGICSEYFDVLLSMENGNVMLSYFNKTLAFHDFNRVQYWLAIKDTLLSINPDILSLWNLPKFLPFVNPLLCNCTSRRPFFQKWSPT